jgi:hypothetical protein
MDLIEMLGNGKIETKPKYDLPEPFSHIDLEHKETE